MPVVARLMRMAWRNLWRARRRTSISVLVISTGLIALVASSRASMPDGWMWVTSAFVFTLVALAISTTMLLAIFERRRELGVLAAVGMRPWQIAVLLLAEAAAPALLAALAAALFGTPLLYWLVQSGIDLRRLGVSGLEPTTCGACVAAYARSALGMLVVALLAGLYPALRAARVDPAAATRGETP